MKCVDAKWSGVSRVDERGVVGRIYCCYNNQDVFVPVGVPINEPCGTIPSSRNLNILSVKFFPRMIDSLPFKVISGRLPRNMS